jgi:protein tyrosine phosphatase
MDSNFNDSLTKRLISKFEDISYDTNKLLKKIIEQSIITISPKNKQSISICDEKKYQYEFSILEKIIDNEDNHISKLSKGNSKNRYSDIRVYEYNKVSLKTNEYINASFINIPYEKCFISTQGPIDSSINDFWEMIFEYDCKIIIMLCNEIEVERKRCSNYWNSKNTNFKIEYKEERKNDLIIRNITFSKNKISKNVIQIQYNGWPDHGIPNIEEAYNSFLNIIHFINENNNNCPVVVHCSAGVGRTGTFLSIYNLVYEIEKKKNNQVIKFSIFNVVRKLKEMRMYLVQNWLQYSFVYEFIEMYLKSLFKK